MLRVGSGVDFRLGGWLAQPARCRLSKDGRTVQVRARVMDLLAYLAARQGQVVSKDDLLNDVWGSLSVSESALTRTVTELRHALGDDADHPRLLETITTRGYRLMGRSSTSRLGLRGHPPRRGFPTMTRWPRVRLTRSGTEELWIADADGSNVRQRTSLRWCLGKPRWSPDGTRVAFTVDHGGRPDLYLLDVRTAEIRPLTSTPELESRRVPPRAGVDDGRPRFLIGAGTRPITRGPHRLGNASFVTAQGTNIGASH